MQKRNGSSPVQPEVIISAFAFLLTVIVVVLFKHFGGKQGAIFVGVVGFLATIFNFVLGTLIYRALARKYKVQKSAEQRKKTWPTNWNFAKRRNVVLVITFISSWICVWMMGLSPLYWFFVNNGEKEVQISIEAVTATDTCLAIPLIEDALGSSPSKSFKQWLVVQGYESLLDCADSESDFGDQQELYAKAVEWATEYDLDSSAAERGFREPTPLPLATPTPGPTQTPVTIIETKEIEVIIQPTGTPMPRSYGALSPEVVRVDSSQAPAIVIYMKINPETLDLLPTDFNVYIDGQFVPVQAAISAKKEQVARYFSVVIDTSESMLDNGKLDAAKSSASTFLSTLSAVDKVQIVAFGSTVTASSWIDPAAAQQTILTLSAYGNTALYDAVAYASAELSYVPGRHYMVVLSDGVDTTSVTTLEGAKQSLSSARAGVFAINLPGGDAALLGDLISLNAESSLVDSSPGELLAVFQGISAVLGSEWRLVVTSPILEPSIVLVEVAAEKYSYEWRK